MRGKKKGEQETLYFYNDGKVEDIEELEAQVADSNLEAGKDKGCGRGESTKNLRKNGQLMSVVSNLIHDAGLDVSYRDCTNIAIFLPVQSTETFVVATTICTCRWSLSSVSKSGGNVRLQAWV